MNDKQREFFVGYFPMPTGLLRFNKLLVLVLFVLAAAGAYWAASSQQSAGQGQWQLDGTVTLQGYISNNPYPVLHTSEDTSRSVMLVMQGKQSAKAFSEQWQGKHVAVSGFAIERGGWSLMEVPAATNIVAADAPANRISSGNQRLGRVQLQGEIVDSKCFMGVMKPGAGKVHRACAAMCIAGGIPPVMIVEQRNGERFGYVLVDQQGGPAADAVKADIAVPVSVSGELEKRGDLTYLYLEPNGIQRL